MEPSPASAAFQQLQPRLPGWFERAQGHFFGRHGRRVCGPAPEALSVKQKHLLSISFPASTGRAAPSAAAAASSRTQAVFSALRRQRDGFWTEQSLWDGGSSWLTLCHTKCSVTPEASADVPGPGGDSWRSADARTPPLPM